ncbi:MAG TPA: hypothetical protein DIT48_09415 [Actinobacteria bacterium]|jgi:hypothetical protein|nr:hypothetical protein [Actinomycetota bacterium]
MLKKIILIPLISFVLVLVAADLGIKYVAQLGVAKELQSTLHLTARPDVSLSGFPFLYHVVKGNFDSAGLKAGPGLASGVPFHSVTLTLQHVQFATGKLATGKGGPIQADAGTGTVGMTGRGVTKVLRDRGIPVTVQFIGTKAVLSNAQLGKVSAGVSVSAGMLLLVPASGQSAFSLRLPPLIKDIRYTGVKLAGGVAFVSFRLDHPKFEVPKI